MTPLADQSRGPEALSVPEMLRIMDVATTIRLDRELVEEQLNLGALKAKLREKMLATAQVTGETVTAEEVDEAIRQYYARLHTFREPEPTFPVVLAHAWVRRRLVGAIAALIILAGSTSWYLYLSPSAPWTERGRDHRKVLDAASRVDAKIAVIRAIANDPKVEPEVERLAREAATCRKADDAKGLVGVEAALDRLEAGLREEYDVVLVPQDTKHGKRETIITRDYRSHAHGHEIVQSGHYVFVQARRLDGTVIPRDVRDAETGRTETVKVWAEQIPDEVFERLKKDKLADGILDETTFAEKVKGRLDEQITMPGPVGRPLGRGRQITRW